MKLQTIVRPILCVVLLAQTFAVSAFETDQYNLPPQPLADIGDEVSDYAQENVGKAVGKINAEIRARQSCLESGGLKAKKQKCAAPEKERAKLEYLRSAEAVARAVYDLLGAGTPPFTKSGTWMDKHRFANQPARYKTSFQKSIFLVFPLDYLTVSATVNLYGSQFGTDKIAHFFQQGYAYYKIYNRALAGGLTPDEAAQKAIRWGQASERTFYGTLVSGVYSNGDLFANYAGMRFYQGLAQEIKIGGAARPAVLILKDGVWAFNENFNSRESLLKPFVSNHLNEALNPSVYAEPLRWYARRVVRRRSCRQWSNRFPVLTKTDFENVSKSLTLWHGEDYGFTESKKFITIAGICFGGESGEKP